MLLHLCSSMFFDSKVPSRISEIPEIDCFLYFSLFVYSFLFHICIIYTPFWLGNIIIMYIFMERYHVCLSNDSLLYDNSTISLHVEAISQIWLYIRSGLLLSMPSLMFFIQLIRNIYVYIYTLFLWFLSVRNSWLCIL